MSLQGVLNLAELEVLARAAMDPGAFDYYYGGAADEITLKENIEAFRRYRLRPRVLIDVSAVDVGTELLSTRVSMPVGLAPAALHKLAHRDGEVATARAAADAGALLCLSTLSSCTLEEVAEASAGPRWFQLYVYKDRSLAEDLVKRVAEAGYEALVLTVDLPVAGYRERDLRNQFETPHYATPASLTADKEFLESIDFALDQSLSWSDLEWIRSISDLPLVVKGVLTPEDARIAVEHGAAAVWVSNHGGRQLDRTPAPIDVLEDVVQAVEGRAEIYLDSGVRRGTDVIVALALGARAVFIGRPYLWGLAAGGQAGVARALELMSAELVNAMTLLGVRNLGEITRAHVMSAVRPSPPRAL